MSAILYNACTILLVATSARAFRYPDHCEFQALSHLVQIQTKKCSLSLTASQTSSIIVTDMAARWHTIADNPDKLLLDVTFMLRGSGTLKLVIMSAPRYIFPFFCGMMVIPATNHVNSSGLVNARLKCDQQAMKLDDEMTLFIDKPERRKRRDVAARINVDLPGCTIPEFMSSVLCQGEVEEKIRFHVRRESSRPVVRVVLSRNAYKSKFEDVRRTRARRYNVAIKEEPPADAWLGRGGGNIIQMKPLSWPKRNVRFHSLQTEKTYLIVVWRNGEMKRYSKKITLC